MRASNRLSSSCTPGEGRNSARSGIGASDSARESAGGVLVTDWYSNPQNPNERMKLSVTILDQDLRADALRIAASREVLQGGAWVAAPVQASTAQKLEDIILTKARDLRRSAIG